MAEKNISKIKISNNEEDIFVLTSKDADKVNELYSSVFGDNTNEGILKYVALLEDKIEILEKKVDALYNGKTPEPLSFEYSSVDSTSYDDGLVESIVLTKVTIGNTTRFGNFDKITVSRGKPISFEWEVIPSTAINKNTSLSSNNDEVVFTDEHSISAINQPGEYLIFITSDDAAHIVKQIKIIVV